MARGKKVLKLRAEAKKFTFKYEGVEQPAGVSGKYYPAEDVVLKKGPAPVRNPPKLRKSITPGTILILLAGRFRGKRVVFLKALASGLLLVSGPYNVNGVPLRRVNQKYVIATSSKVSMDGVDATIASIDDKFFARSKAEGEAAEGTVTSPERKAAQAKVDAVLKANVAKTDMLEHYLKALFSLSKSDKPHLLKF